MLDFRTISLQAAALLLPAWLQQQSLDRAREGLGVSVPAALVEVFECTVLHSWFGSLACPVPGCSRELLALPRDARRGTAVAAVQAAASSHGPRKAEATWEAKEPVGKGSTVPEVNTSAVLALPEVGASAAGVGACRGQSRGQSMGSAHGGQFHNAHYPQGSVPGGVSPMQGQSHSAHHPRGQSMWSVPRCPPPQGSVHGVSPWGGQSMGVSPTVPTIHRGQSMGSVPWCPPPTAPHGAPATTPLLPPSASTPDSS